MSHLLTHQSHPGSILSVDRDLLGEDAHDLLVEVGHEDLDGLVGLGLGGHGGRGGRAQGLGRQGRVQGVQEPLVRVPGKEKLRFKRNLTVIGMAGARTLMRVFTWFLLLSKGGRGSDPTRTDHGLGRVFSDPPVTHKKFLTHGSASFLHFQ